MVESIKKFVNENKILVAILALAFFVRMYGVSFDYPFGVNYIWDEIAGGTQIADILTKMSFFTDHVSGYGFVLPLIYIPTFILRIVYLAVLNSLWTASAIKGFLISGGMGQLYISMRWLSVLFGTLNAYFIYKICFLAYEKKNVSLYTAFAYSIAILPVSLAHWGKVHTAMSFFFMLSLYFIIKFEKTKEIKNFYYSSAAAALSFSTHYIGLTAGIFPLMAFFLNRSVIDFKVLFRGLLIYFGLSAFFYGVNFRGVSIMFEANSGNGIAGMNKDSTLWERISYPFLDLFWLDPILVSVSALSILANIKNIFTNKLLRYFLFGLANVYLLLSAFIAWPGMVRWLLVFMTLLLVLGISIMAQNIFDSEKLKKRADLLLVLLLIPSLLITFRWLYIFNTDTRTESISWMKENLERGRLIYSFETMFDPEISFKAASWDKENNRRDSKKNDYIILNKELFMDKGIDLIHDYENNRYEQLGGKDTGYIYMSYWKNTNKLFRPNGEPKYYYPDGSARDEIKEKLVEISKYHEIELIKTFYPTTNSGLIFSGVGDYLNNPVYFYDIFRLDKSGPFVEIYKVTK